jgi:AcrR family transcriptional regulator
MTKGALYQHFDSMESLASAIIEDGSATVLNAFRSNCEASSPAMENMIHGTFVVADTLGSDEVACAAEQLTLALGGFNEAVSRVCANWVEAMAAQGRRAIVEGDLREDLDPETVSMGTFSWPRTNVPTRRGWRQPRDLEPRPSLKRV